MIKRLLLMLVVVGTLCLLSSCSSAKPAATHAEPTDLAGEWKQVNSNSKETWHSAVIEGETITIYWVSDGGNAKSLYWAGTYVAPKTSVEPYSWASANDHSQTDTSLFASGDDTKTITYEKGQLSYSASALGTTTTVRLAKQK